MLNRPGRRYWSRSVLGDRLESQVKDTRVATADLDTAIDTVVDILTGTVSGLSSPADNWGARYTWKSEEIRLIDSILHSRWSREGATDSPSSWASHDLGTFE